jgi:hypothetical protein
MDIYLHSIQKTYEVALYVIYGFALTIILLYFYKTGKRSKKVERLLVVISTILGTQNKFIVVIHGLLRLLRLKK